jgi:hypothetical protein
VTLAEGTTAVADINKLEAAVGMKFLRSRGEELGKWVLENGKIRRSLKEITRR